MRLEGKTAIITGSAGGMGAEEARLFAREGANVVVSDVIDEEGEATVRQIVEAGGKATYIHADVTSVESWDALVGATVEKYGTVDILVNNAGLSSGYSLDPHDIEGWTRIMDVNCNGVYLGTRAVIPIMQKAGRGSIVNISSIMGFVAGEGGHPAYHASKGAVRIFTKATAVRYGPEGNQGELGPSGLHAGNEVGSRFARRRTGGAQTADSAAPGRGDDRSRLRCAVPRVRRGLFRDRDRARHRRRLHSALGLSSLWWQSLRPALATC